MDATAPTSVPATTARPAAVPHGHVPVRVRDVVRALGVAGVWITAASATREPARQRAQVAIIGAAAGTYLNGGFGRAELVFATTAGYGAYRGARSYRWIGASWIAHTVWDLAHHVAGRPMISWLPTSSMECAVTDTVLAVWFLAGAPDVLKPWRAAVAGLREQASLLTTNG